MSLEKTAVVFICQKKYYDNGDYYPYKTAAGGCFAAFRAGVRLAAGTAVSGKNCRRMSEKIKHYITPFRIYSIICGGAPKCHRITKNSSKF